MMTTTRAHRRPKSEKKGQTGIWNRPLTPRLYPDCGCLTPEDCIPCPNCGRCMRGVDVCACRAVASDERSGYDPFDETSGGA